MLIEAESDVAGLKERNIDIVRQLEEEKHRAKEAQRELDEFKAIAGRALEAVTAIQADPENEEHLESWKNLAPELTVDDLKAQIIAENTRLEFVVASNPNAMNEFKRRQVEVDKLTRKVVETEEELELEELLDLEDEADVEEEEAVAGAKGVNEPPPWKM